MSDKNLPALTDLAERINAEHAAALSAAQTAIERAAECGRLLIEAKSGLSHGQAEDLNEISAQLETLFAA